ncbi:MFS transporter [Actinoplanes sp. KI2]|uniref:MFS transporter n=1 Tax=Actinoplanes sp. KI2 TaxID=2983315 RepID=UPI0021D5D7B0|nr:MFS transporter [Actinoplanes sp. KI2]MCU7727551.1 MFS transporter [Actinoplanes sp. KI2]
MVVVLCGAAASYSVLQSLVVPALGTFQRQLDTTASGVAWLLTAYLLSASVLTPVIGRLGDLFGKRRALVGSLAALAAGAALSAVAQDLPTMLAGRVIQGAGGAVFPLAFAIIRDHVTPGLQARAIAAISAVLSVGGAAATLLAGPVIELLSYHWLFWLPAGLAVAAAGATLKFAPETRRVHAGRISVPGVLLFAGWLTTLLMAITELPAGRPGTVLALAGITLPLAAGWAWWELRAAQPMVDLRTLRRPQMRDTNVATLLLGLGMFAAWMIVPLLVQQDPRTGVGFGAPAAAVGLYLLPTAAGTLAVTPLVGRIGEASGPRSALFLGGLAAAVSYGWMAVAHGSRVSLLLALLLEGAGIGLAFAAVAVRTVRSVPADQTGVATGINTIMRTVGGTLGTNLAGMLLAATATVDGQPSPAAYTVCFAVFGVALLGAALLGLRPEAGPDTTLSQVREHAPVFLSSE